MGKAPITFGALGEWTKARDLPQADGESFRQWFNNRERCGMDLTKSRKFS